MDTALLTHMGRDQNTAWSTSGLRTRRSTSTQAIATTTATTIRKMTSHDPQPQVGSSLNAMSSAIAERVDGLPPVIRRGFRPAAPVGHEEDHREQAERGQHARPPEHDPERRVVLDDEAGDDAADPGAEEEERAHQGDRDLTAHDGELVVDDPREHREHDEPDTADRAADEQQRQAGAERGDERADGEARQAGDREGLLPAHRVAQAAQGRDERGTGQQRDQADPDRRHGADVVGGLKGGHQGHEHVRRDRVADQREQQGGGDDCHPAAGQADPLGNGHGLRAHRCSSLPQRAKAIPVPVPAGVR
jgi:hypothetical protein